MTKNSKLLLEDYLKDKSELRLSLFANSVNNLFKLDKTSKEQLKTLIADYELNKLPARLKIIDSFLATNKEVPAARIKPSDIKNNTVTKFQKDAPKANEELKSLQKQMQAYVGRGRNWDLNEKYIELSNKIKEIETKAGMFNEYPREEAIAKAKLDIVLGLIGHWEDSKSIAYELINGTRPRITIKSGVDMKDILQWLTELSGKQARHFIVQNDDLSGSLYGRASNSNPTYTLTDVHSGLQPIKDNFTSQMMTENGSLVNSNIDLFKQGMV